jgi:signal transduction histidine kinase
MRSIRSRLFLAALVAVLVSIGFTLLVGAVLVRRSVERSALTNLGREAALVAARHEARPIGSPVPRNLRVLLASLGDRLVVLRRPEARAGLFSADQRQALAAGQAVSGRATIQGRDILFAAQPAAGDVVFLYRPAGLAAADWRPFLGSFLVAGVVGTAAAGAGAYFLAGAISRPVRRVAEASRSLAAGERPGTLPVEGADELAVLASSFNDMAAELARARDAEQGFLLSVSHELKTPLTAIRGYAEALEEGAVEPTEGGEVILREAVRLERLVQDVLDLARMNRHAFAVRRQPVDLGAVAREAVRRYEQRAKAFRITLAADPPEADADPAEADADPAESSLAVLADHDRVLQVVSNLVENALRATPAGGTVTVSAAPGTLAVRDSGPGLLPEDLPRAFERFFLYGRYGAERPVGSGLGLAIVKELSEAMGGSVTAESGPSGGALFTLRLPLPERPDRDGSNGGSPGAIRATGTSPGGPASPGVPQFPPGC